MIDCSKTENYLKEKTRLCKSFNFCIACPLINFCKIATQGVEAEGNNAKEIISIVQKWSDEHPQKTYKDDFFEKFPNAFKNTLGEPMYCRKNLYEGADSNSCYSSGCTDCWNEAMPE